MCTSIVEIINVEGSGKGAEGWFPVTRAVVDYDHPTHALLEQSINIDFVNQSLAAGMRVAVELTTESARALARAILAALEAAERAQSPRPGKIQVTSS
jgi:hypothetical protein